MLLQGSYADDQSMSRRKIFHRDAIRILDISRNRRSIKGLAWITSGRLALPARLHYIPPNEEVLSGSFSTHEYRIHCNGLCTLQATSTPFPKLNYLSLVRFFFRFVFVPLQLLYHIGSSRCRIANFCKFSPIQSSSVVI